jgi:hypothetical protein
MESHLKNNQSLLSFLEINKVTDFQLRRVKGESNSVIFRTEENLSDADNRHRLLNFFDESKGSYWLVENKKNGAISIKVDNGDYSSTNTPAAQIGSIFDNKEKIETEAKRLFDEWLKDEKIKQLEKENSELSTLAHRISPWEKAYDKIEPFVPHIINGLTGKIFPGQPIGLAGIEQQNQTHIIESEEIEDITNEFTEDEGQRIEDACVKWAQADAKFYEVIEYLADFSVSGKEVMGMDYQKLRAMLFNFKY